MKEVSLNNFMSSLVDDVIILSRKRSKMIFFFKFRVVPTNLIFVLVYIEAISYAFQQWHTVTRFW